MKEKRKLEKEKKAETRAQLYEFDHTEEGFHIMHYIYSRFVTDGTLTPLFFQLDRVIPAKR